MTTIALPGLIDPHVHFREPGLTHKGDMESEAAAAFAGGVTTVCDMPNTIPTTTSVAAFADKVERAKRIKNVDIRFFFGITERAHIADLRSLWEDAALRARCSGVKLYLDHSTGNQKAEGAVVEEAFKACAELDCLIVAHCEDAAMNAKAASEHAGTDIALHSLQRPPEAEEKSVMETIALAKEYGTRFHVAHLSTKGALAIVRKAKAEGLPVTCEVAPHHLFLTTDDYALLGTLAKMNPPLRARDHLEALWGGIADGTVDCIATDHAPHTLEEKKTSDPLKAPSGVPGVATMLPLLLTVAAGGWPHPSSARPAIDHFDYETIRHLCFDNPNEIFRLGKTPVMITIDLDAEWVIRGKELPGKCGWTPFEGWNVRGKIMR